MTVELCTCGHGEAWHKLSGSRACAWESYKADYPTPGVPCDCKQFTGPDQSILVIRGSHAQLVQIRRKLIRQERQLGWKTSHVIFRAGRLNKHVPDLKDGYEKFSALLWLCLRGPIITQWRANGWEEHS